ncbi:MAG: heavy metal translocating P-type ATPase [Planctomycetales bacterium]|nr:heavy metal translocating P-type ATPase [Planctomycetales bacterium]
MNAEESTRYCALCGLPVLPTLAWSRENSAGDLEYCCSGCRTVASIDEADSLSDSAASSVWRMGVAIFFAMNVMVFTLALWSRDVYSADAYTTELADVLHGLFRWAALLFSLPVLFLLGEPIAVGVWQALRRRSLTTDFLILLGVSAAFAYSTVSVLRGEGQIYFEVAVMVLVFVSLGRYLEARGKLRASQSLDELSALLPATARRRDAQGGFTEVAAAEIRTDDVIRVLPGERLPVDGILCQGSALIDEQIVTGESTASEKTLGDPVYSGTLNIDGDLQITVTAANGQETLSRILALVREARLARPAYQRLADRIVYWFLPTVCLIAIVSAYWQGAQHGADRGILTALAVVLIACPCALGLATPMALWTSLGRAAEGGVLFRSGLVVEQLASIRGACFDKTGTLTTGAARAAEFLPAAAESPEHLLPIAGDIAAGSSHGASQAVLAYVENHVAAWRPTDRWTVESLPGRGVLADDPGWGRVALGSRRLMTELGCAIPADLADRLERAAAACQQVFLAVGDRVAGVFLLHEHLRDEAVGALQTCRQLGLRLALLTGDDSNRARAIGQACGIESHGQLLPEEKAAHIQELARRGTMAMIGDGLNDAPAIATTQVGVALGCGADVTRDAAGVCLLSNDLRRFPWAVRLARHTLRVVKQNLFWAFAYNSAGILLAATGRLNPIWAALAMAISSLLVVTNSLRLGRFPLGVERISPAGSAAPALKSVDSGHRPATDELTAAGETAKMGA